MNRAKLNLFITKELAKLILEDNSYSKYPGDIPIKNLTQDELSNIIRSTIPGNTEVDKILDKFKSLKKVILDLFTSVYNDYIENIFIIAPKPTTFKVVLKNTQHFLLTYTPKSYIATIRGKKYHLTSDEELQRALQSLFYVLNIGIPAPKQGPPEETPSIEKEKKPRGRPPKSENEPLPDLDNEPPLEEPEEKI